MKIQYEMFGHLVYSEELTYEELISLEQKFTTECSVALKDMGASFLNFTPLGDALYIQCVFVEQEASAFEGIGEAIANFAGYHVDGRLLFVCRELNGLWCFFIHGGTCRIAELMLPSPSQGVNKEAPHMLYTRECIRIKLPIETSEDTDAVTTADKTPLPVKKPVPSAKPAFVPAEVPQHLLDALAEAQQRMIKKQQDRRNTA